MNITNFIKNDSSYSLSAIPISSERTSNEMSTAEKYVHWILSNPNQLEVLVQNLLKSNPSLILEFINNLLSQYLGNPELVASIIFCCIQMIPTELHRQLLEEYPITFFQILDCMNSNQREKVLKSFVKVNEWQTLFVKVWKALDQTTIFSVDFPFELTANVFLKNLMDSLPSRCKKQWIKFCSSNLEADQWAFFIVMLNSKQSNLLLSSSIKNCSLKDRKEQKKWIPYLNSLSQQPRNLAKSICFKILNKFYQTKAFSAFLDLFDQLNFETQICFLDKLSDSKKKKFFHFYHKQNVKWVKWLHGLFNYHIDYEQRIKMLRYFLAWISDEKLALFLQIFRDMKSPLGPFLLVSLSEERLQALILDNDHVELTKLISYGQADATTFQFLQDLQLKQQFLYENMHLDLNTAEVPVDSNFPFTLKECYQTLQQGLLCEELLNDYRPFIQKIPSFLIGLLSLQVEYREVLLKLTSYLTDEQLKFLIHSLRDDEVNAVIEQILPKLNSAQYMMILGDLTTIQLKDYIQDKTYQLQAIYLDLKEKLNPLQVALAQAQGNTEVTYSTYNQLQIQGQNVTKLARRSSQVDCYYLLQFLKQLPQQNIALEKFKSNFENIVSQFAAIKKLVEGPHAVILLQLETLEKRISQIPMEEEIDLSMELYAGFWVLVKERTLPYLGISACSSLGITHAGQLSLLGIHSDQDLLYLGISPLHQHTVEKLMTEVVPLLADTKKFQEIWNDFLEIKLEEKELQNCMNQLIELLNIEMQNPIHLQQVCIKFCQNLLLLQHLLHEERENIQTGLDLLNKGETRQDICNRISTLFTKSFFALRGQYPLFCLQRYLLKNVDLKLTWEKLHSLNYKTISDLFKANYIQSFADLLHLKEIVDELVDN